MATFNETYKRIIEDVTATSAFGAVGAGVTGGQFPANNDKGYAPGDARIPCYIGSKKVKGKRKRKILMQRR
tara:strand:+ start:9266 stop:9478 length:213 start_codon:yes stop_codon:yes gene_type:complete